MPIDIEAVYENGVLKPAQPLPLQEHERVFVRVRSRTSEIRKTAGIIPFSAVKDCFDEAHSSSAFSGPKGHSFQ